MKENEIETGNASIFGTENYEKVQIMYENRSWGECFYSLVFMDEWVEEVQRRKMMGE